MKITENFLVAYTKIALKNRMGFIKDTIEPENLFNAI